jgi:glycosyltransferase involved in cell wall biosynthesis
MRIAYANFVRPPDHSDPDRLFADWPTLLDVAAAVAETGVEITVLQSFGRDIEIMRRGVTCRFIHEPALPGSWSGVSPWRVARAAVGARAQVIHVNGLDFAAHTRAMTATGIPVLVQDHASRAGMGRLLRGGGLADVAGAAFTDAEQARPFVEEGSLPAAVRIFSVPESSTRFAPGDQEAARAATGTYGDPMLLWVGRLDDNKDPLLILSALEIAAADMPGAHLWCCFHEQPLLAQVEQRLAASPVLAERVHLLGRVPHERIELLCRAADIFVLASHHEGSSYALIEALACGLTPVVSDIPPFRSLTGGTGFLAQPNDPRSFAAGIAEIAARPRADLRRKAIEHFQANLSFAAIGARLAEI